MNSTTTTTGSTSQPVASFSSSASPCGRLPAVVIPYHYDLVYDDIDLNLGTFAGQVSIHVNVAAASGVLSSSTTQQQQSPPLRITLNTLELQIVKAQLVAKIVDDDNTTNNNNHDNKASAIQEEIRLDIDSEAAKTKITKPARSWDAEEFIYRPGAQTCELVFSETTQSHAPPLDDPQPHYILIIDFTGILNSQMQGLYKSTYTIPTPSGTNSSLQSQQPQQKIMACTQFEPTAARRAFPCFDEPALKATFRLKVTIPYALQAISNTPIASCHTATSSTMLKKTITFETTPVMSTYLLALIVGEFDVVSTSVGGIRTSVYTVPGKAHQAQFCLQVASKCLDWYQQHLFHIPYPLEKSDLIAIPDFASGAMENWGCVTYREAKILVQPGVTSDITRRGIARTVCHELAHQWFGNLVTMEFWTQLWLNEGFARYMEFVAIDHLFPSWDIWTEFVQSVYGLALSLDALEASHPVEVPVHHPDDIREIFDAISYAKGASIIRMACSYIGSQVFYDGLKLYLTRHAYQNTTTEDLWRALAETSGQPMIELMTPWTSQVGYPILILPDFDDDRDTDDDTKNPKTIEVRRFLASGPNSFASSLQASWPVPVTVLVEGLDGVQGPWLLDGPTNNNHRNDLLAKMKEWTLQDKWFKLNADQWGFYRTLYTPQQWHRLAERAMKKQTKPKSGSQLSPQLSASDRLGLISDSFAAGRAGYSNIVDSLKLVHVFSSNLNDDENDGGEPDYDVWEEIAENLSSLANLYRSQDFFGNFQAYLRQVFGKQMAKLGWGGDQSTSSSRTGTLRGTIIEMMVTAGDQEVIRKGYDCFRQFFDSITSTGSVASLSGDLRSAVYKAALRHDEATVYPALRQMYEQSSFPEEQRTCLSVMGSVKDRTRHAEMLDYVLFSGKVRTQDIIFPLKSLCGTTDDGGAACWQYFVSNFNPLQQKYMTGPMWASIVGLCCRGLVTLEQAHTALGFFGLGDDDDDVNDRQPQSDAVGSAKRILSQALEAVLMSVERMERDRGAVQAYLSEFSS